MLEGVEPSDLSESVFKTDKLPLLNSTNTTYLLFSTNLVVGIGFAPTFWSMCARHQVFLPKLLPMQDARFALTKLLKQYGLNVLRLTTAAILRMPVTRVERVKELIL